MLPDLYTVAIKKCDYQHIGVCLAEILVWPSIENALVYNSCLLQSPEKSYYFFEIKRIGSF